MSLTHLSDEALIASLTEVCADGHRWLARLVQHLVEVEDRRLHLKAACSSMFDFCVRRLRMSEGAAFRQINAARLVRRFPRLLVALERGAIHLSSLVMLRDHLTESNLDELLAATSGKSKREVQELLARRAPRPDVPATLRKLPAARRGRDTSTESAEPPPASLGPRADAAALLATPRQVSVPASLVATSTPRCEPASPVATPSPQREPASLVATPSPQSEPSTYQAPPSPPAGPPTRAPARAPAYLEPLSEDRYKLQLTATAALRDKLERARDLMRHRNPAGDLAVVVERALDALLEQLEKERLARTTRPQKTVRPATAGRIARSVRRAVFQRDGERCTFASESGERCPSTTLLELDHIHPRALGGPNTPANLRVRCRAHNLLHAEAVFGRPHVTARVASRQQNSRSRAQPRAARSP